VHIFVENYVPRLQISVHNLLRAQVFQRENNLGGEVSRQGQTEHFLSFEESLQASLLAILDEQVQFALELKRVV